MKKLNLLVLLALIVVSINLEAASLTYDGGVSGVWTNSGSGWLDGGSAANWNNATPDSAVFGGTTPTAVNVEGGVTVGNVTVTNGTYSIGGAGTLTMSNTTWSVGSGLTNTVSTALAGTTGLTKSGAGVLSLSGINKNFTGGVTINGGAIQIASAAAGALGSANSTAITLDGGSLYTSFGANTTVNYAITVGAGGGELRNLGGDTGRFIMASNKFSGSGTLTLSFGTSNTRFQMGTTTQTGFSGKWVIDSGGNVNRFVDVDGNSTFGNITGDDAITLVNSGTILFRESRTYGAGYGITLGSGGGKINGGGNKTVVVAGKLSGAEGNTLTLGVENGTVLVLSNTANSYLGETAIVANSGTTGVVRLGMAGVIPDAGGTVTVGSGTTLDLNGFSETIGGLAGVGTVNSSTGAGVLAAGANNSNSTFSGLLANGAGTLALAKVGTGNLTLSTSNSFSGGTTVRAGRLIVANANALGGGDVLLQSTATGTSNRAYLTLSNLTVSGKTLTMDSTTNRAILLSTSAGGGTWDGTITLQGSSSGQGTTELANDTGNGPLIVAGTVGGSISGGGALTLRGLGTTNVLSAAVNIGATPLEKTDTGAWRVTSSGNTWGATTINSGSLLVGSSDALPNGTAVSIAAAGTLDVGGYSETVGSIAGAGRIDNSGAASTLTVGGNNTSTTFSGVLTNSGSALSLTKTGSGTLTLSGTNYYTGATTVNGGALIIDGRVAGSVNVAAGGVLGGQGVIGGATTISGSLQPGNSPGILTFDNGLTLESTAEITMELAGLGGVAGTDFDQIKMTGGNLSYGGKLTITSWNGYDLTQYTSYQLFDFGSLTVDGNFSGVTVGGTALNYDNFNTWSGTSGTTVYSFTIDDGVLTAAAVPEPSTYALLGLGAVAFAGYVIRRRRR